MYFDLFLISALLVAGYLGPTIVRRHPPGQRGFGWLLLADGGCAAVALYLRQGSDDALGDLLGFVALAAAFFLLVVPPFLRDATHRAMGAGKLGLARFLLGVRETLQPGMGAREERELIDTIVAVRTKGVDDELAILEETLENLSDPRQRRSIEDRILFTYLTARRWPEAVRAFEQSGQPESCSPQLVVELVRAYSELDQLERAADLARKLEGAPWANEPAAVPLIARSRLVFLAFCGRVREVEKLVGPGGPLEVMPQVSRSFWLGVALLNAGDRAAARAALEDVIERASDDPPTQGYARAVLERAENPDMGGPRALPSTVADLADLLAERVSSMRSAPAQRVPRLHRVAVAQVPVTAAVIAANLLIFALVMFVFGSTGDPGALVRAGANVKSAVWVGEWWRFFTSLFLHVGLAHLLLNMYGLWVLGKLVEQIHGPARTFALYIISGLGGSVASAIFGGPTMSVGASGAIMGLLGALIGDLLVARRVYPEPWRKSLLRQLIFVAAAMVAIGLFYDAIDQSAHVGGLVVGFLLGALLSPHSAMGRATFTRLLGAALVALSALCLTYSAFSVLTTDYGTTLARYGSVEHRTVDNDGGLAFIGPTVWQRDDGIRFDDPFVVTHLELQIEPAGRAEIGQLLDLLREHEEADTPSVTRRPPHARMVLPDPWQSRELLFTRDDMGGEQVFRLIIFGRHMDDEVWVGNLLISEALADDMEPTITRMLASMRRL